MRRLSSVVTIFLTLFLVFGLPIYADDNIKVPKHRMEMVVAPTARFTGKWAFIVDASSSIWWKPNRGTFDRLKDAFKMATENAATDDFTFCVYKFNDRDREEYMAWQQGSPKNLKKAFEWICAKQGIFSYGKKSIAMALHQPVPELTLIIITDGGFSSSCYGKGFGEVYGAIKEGQKWRNDNGYSDAIICTIGVENKDYWAGGKPSDEDCQAFLRKIGTEYHGGYFLVSKI